MMAGKGVVGDGKASLANSLVSAFPGRFTDPELIGTSKNYRNYAGGGGLRSSCYLFFGQN